MGDTLTENRKIVEMGFGWGFLVLDELQDIGFWKFKKNSEFRKLKEELRGNIY